MKLLFVIRLFVFSLFQLSLVCYSGNIFSLPIKKNVLKVEQTKCEYLINPLGIDVMAPRLGWKISASQQVFNQKQKAYQILVATSTDKLTESAADLWNSRKILSDQHAQVVYNGKALVSGQKCYWIVRIWNSDDQVTAWSEVAFWSMGLLNKSDWKAKWIGDQPDLAQKVYADYLNTFDPAKNIPVVNSRPVGPPSPMLRKTFNVKPAVKEAVLYVSALGYYEIGLNGKKIGDHQLAPEWTDYDKRLQYQTYDLTKTLKEGDNVLSSVLGDGWYLGMIGPTKWLSEYPRRGVYGNDRRLIAQLMITYENGEQALICTDDSWRINSQGFIISADNFLGQQIDAQYIPQGWKDIGFDDQHWGNVFVDFGVSKNMEAQKNEPVRINNYFSPIDIKQLGDKYIVDFGQNLTGWTRMKVKGKKGDTIMIRHGEMLDDDGSLYTKNLAAAIQEDRYVLSGNNDEFEPTFTYHGFRFVEISGLNSMPTAEMIKACALSSDPEVTGTFACSNPKLNQLWSNIIWTQRNNMTSVPTDCPQRDERMGWMGDAQVFCQNSMFNMDMAAFYSKWIKDIRDAQSARGTFPDIAPHANKPDIRFSNAPAWADAGVIIPWRMYENYGDKELLRQHYTSMKRYIENIRTQNPKFLWLNDVGNQYGDWLNANTIIADGYSNTRGEIPREVFATAFYANSVKLFSKIAAVLENEKDAREYRQLFDSIYTKFNDAYVDDSARIKGNTQSAYALALHFDLLPEAKQDLAFQHLIECLKEYDNRISTGFVTTLMMMKELTKRGRNDLAYGLLESERFPSWIYSINQGATTIWERWDGYVKGRGFQDPSMNSFCHYSIGSVGEWMYRVLLGINPSDQEPGFKKIIIHPQPGGTITWAKGSYNSISGIISIDWEKTGSMFSMDVEIPVNATATVILPSANPAAIRMNSKKLSTLLSASIDKRTGETSIELGSGKYNFVVDEIAFF
jgi:alpha-L-rhamnosidase